MIKQSTIDQVLSAVQLEEIIGEYVSLKKAGANYKGLSPFKQEKTPSFVVSPAKQCWYDFSMGKGGNIFTFLKEIEHFSFPEAIKFLAKKYGIEVEEDQEELSSEQIAARDEKEQLFKIHEIAARWFHQQMMETEEGKSIALGYFLQRGITLESVTKFQLGFGTEMWDGLYKHLTQLGFSDPILEKSGLVYFSGEKGTDSYSGKDRFRERIMFPILSYSGRVLGFGGRIMKNNVPVAKYINSPESPIYHKSDVLFGIAQARSSITKNDVCYLTEGYMDVIAMHQTGITNTVSSSGTALSVAQIQLIKRLTRNVSILFDGDEAGIKASFRSIDLLLEEAMNVRVLLFPDGHDPDSFVREKSSEEVLEFISSHQMDFIDFKTQILLQDKADDPLERGKCIQDILSSIAKVPSALQRELFVQKTARTFNLAEENIFKELAQKIALPSPSATKKHNKAPKMDIVEKRPRVEHLLVLENALVELLLKYSSKNIHIIEEDGNELNSTLGEEILDHLEEWEYQPIVEMNHLIFKEAKECNKENKSFESWLYGEMIDAEIAQKLASINITKYELSNWEQYQIHIHGEEEKSEENVFEVINRHKRELILKRINTIKERFKDSEIPEEEKKTIMKLIKLKITIDKDMHRVH